MFYFKTKYYLLNYTLVYPPFPSRKSPKYFMKKPTPKHSIFEQ